MSANWVLDIEDMHTKFGVNDAIDKLTPDQLKQFLEFRIKFLQEELDEMSDAKSADDVVDALIDLCVVAITTLDAYQVDSYEAWNRVLDANMAKEAGVNPSRPNPLGLPDLIKLPGWVAPTHKDNVGLLSKIF